MLLLPFLPEGGAAFAVVLAASILVSAWLCGRAEKSFGGHDCPQIVLDEVVGFWTAVAFLPRTGGVLAAGFILFRLLDSWKLPPYRSLEKLPGGWGVVADDVGAGICANLLIRAWMWAQ